MKMKSFFTYFGKLFVCCSAFFTGLVVSSILLPKIGFSAFNMTEGMIAVWYMTGSMILGLMLSFLARRLRANLLVRWMVLAELVWAFAVVGMGIEIFFFTATGIASVLVHTFVHLLGVLLPVVLFSGALAVLFRPVAADRCLGYRYTFLARLEAQV